MKRKITSIIALILSLFFLLGSSWQELTLDYNTHYYYHHAVLDRSLTAPPGTLNKDDKYLIADGATGAWVGQDGNIALWNGSSWEFVQKRPGMLVYVLDENIMLMLTQRAVPAVKLVRFALNVGIGNQAVTGAGFRPSAVFFFYNRSIAEEQATELNGGYGMMTAAAQGSIAFTDEHNVNPTNSYRRSTNAASITTITPAGGVLEQASYVSMDSDGFTINITTAGLAIIVYALCFNEDDFQASIVQWPAIIVTGDQDVTGAGFQPNSLISISMTSGTLTTSTSSARMLIGMTDASLNQSCVAGTSVSAIALSNTRKSWSSSNMIYFPSSGGANAGRGAVTQYLADGFRINWDTAPSGAYYIHTLCLKNLYNKNTVMNHGTNLVQIHVPLPFKPQAELYMYGARASSAITTIWTNSVGVSDSSLQGMIEFYAQHGVIPSNTYRQLSYSKVIDAQDLAELSFLKNTDTGFDINLTVSDGTNRQMGILAWSVPYVWERIARNRYTLPVMATNLSVVADSTTYYFGSVPVPMSTVEGNTLIVIPRAAAITFVSVSCITGTVGSNEDVTLYLRVNGATDYLIDSGPITATRLYFQNYTPWNIELVAGDSVEFKFVTPVWAANPSDIAWGGYVFMEESP